jgi:hypothetical protein
MFDDDPPPRNIKLLGNLDWLDEDHKVAITTKQRTKGQIRRAKRNAIIIAANRIGFNQRFIAEALQLPRSVVGAIIRKGKP